MYVDDETTLLLVALLKAWKVRQIVASPGTQNAGFNYAVQQDSAFEVHSAVDERGAAYMAAGLAYELNEPVVITCTGATASRNYCSAMTEAYYRKLPIIAITFIHYITPFNMDPQMVDRSVTQNDIKTMSVRVQPIQSQPDRMKAMIQYNAALAKVFSGAGPVHIEVVNHPHRAMHFNTEKLPANIWWPQLCSVTDLGDVQRELYDEPGAVHIGSHRPFTPELQEAISAFALSHKVPVFVDHTANYHGANKVLTQAASMGNLARTPSWILDIGGITGDYTISTIFSKAKLWRISPNGELLTRRSTPVAKLIHAEEAEAFAALTRKKGTPKLDYYSEIRSYMDSLIYPELPFSTPGICQALAHHLPARSSLHLAILNSLRSMNFFPLQESIRVNCNVGGFGIDGALSTLVGQSWADRNRLCFAIVGDLAFFYDMNALGNRQIHSNIRIMLINNGRGEEFRLNPLLEKPFAEKTDPFVAAADHFRSGAQAWAEACGFTYLQARNKDEFHSQMQRFCDPKPDKKPLLFECFTTNEDEQEAIRLLRTLNKTAAPAAKKESKGLLSKIVKKISSSC